MDAGELTQALKQRAHGLGFALAGACPAVTPVGVARFHQWLEAGYAGQMSYLPDRAEAYEHPGNVLEGVRSLLLLAANYRTGGPSPPAANQGRVACYAWGADYHDTLRGRLHDLCDFLREAAPGARARGVVDTAPLLEREFAQLAGLGWIGKNTLLLNKRLGSWFFLAAVLTDAELAYDEPHAADHCGTCRACLDACPTDAFVDAYVLDSRKCISYLTIELRQEIPVELRPGMGDWLFGCDVCQDVCPWNGRAPMSDDPGFAPLAAMNPVDLPPLFDLDDAAFRQRFRGTPLWRSKRRGLLRNAAIVLGNQASPDALPALTKGLHDVEPLVRGAAAWALGRLNDSRAVAALRGRLEAEQVSDVRREIQQALGSPGC